MLSETLNEISKKAQGKEVYSESINKRLEVYTAIPGAGKNFKALSNAQIVFDDRVIARDLFESDSGFIDALKTGKVVLFTDFNIDNNELVSVIDYISKNDELTIEDKTVDSNGLQTIKIHPDFKIILTINARN